MFHCYHLEQFAVDWPKIVMSRLKIKDMNMSCNLSVRKKGTNLVSSFDTNHYLRECS